MREEAGAGNRSDEAAALFVGTGAPEGRPEFPTLPARDTVPTARARLEPSRFGAPGRGHLAQIETLWRYSRVARSSG